MARPSTLRPIPALVGHGSRSPNGLRIGTSGTPVLLGSVTTRIPKTCGGSERLKTHHLVHRVEGGLGLAGHLYPRRSPDRGTGPDRKSTRLNSSHLGIS